MAIGARITSENLSGKTATVTFIPYTGSTSGTTQNLGTKVIPFNNITSHPYGVYNIYLAEYDYTYTLTVEQPVTESQLFVHSDRMTTSNNYGVATLNFTDFTAEVIDLGIDSSYWNNRDVYPLTESGFGYYFRGNDNSDERLVIFTDASNNIVGQYSGTTEDYNMDTLNGKWITFEDEDNGVLKYFNGTEMFTYTWDPVNYYIDIESDYEAVMGDGSFILKKYTRGQWTYNGDGSSYIMKPDGTVIPFKTFTDVEYLDHMIVPTIDFIVVENRTQGQSNVYTSLEIYNTDGEILETVSLTGATYTSVNFTFLGTDKMCAVYYNWDDDSVDYKIIHYNGTTQTLIETSHVRGTDYPSTEIMGSYGFNDSDRVDGSVVISFYKPLEYNNSVGIVCDYFDFVYMLNNQTEFTTYVVTDNENRVMSPWGTLGNTFKVWGGTTGNTIGLLTITTNGVSITDLNEPISGITNNDYYSIGDRVVAFYSTNNGIDMFFYLIGADGSVLDSLSPVLTSNYNYNINTRGDVAYLSYTRVGDGEVQDGYYVYSGSTGFTATDYYNNSNSPRDFIQPTFIEPSTMLLQNSDQLGYRILTNNGITEELSFPEYNDISVRVGKDKYMVVYEDSETGVIKINLYNFTGELLNSHTTNYTTWDDVYSAKDRFVVIFQGEGTKEFFLVSEETITSVVMVDFDGETTINDIFWWYEYND